MKKTIQNVILSKKIEKYLDPFWTDVYDKRFVIVDGVEMKFYYPFTGNPDLFKCRGSTFSLSGYLRVFIDFKNERNYILDALSQMQ